MDEYTAARLEGMLIGSRGHLEMLAAHIRDAVPAERRRELLLKIGWALSDLVDISREIYKEHPKVNPYFEDERTSAQRYAAHMREKAKRKGSPGSRRKPR